MISECDHNINSSSRYRPSEFCTKLNYVYTTRQCDEYFEYLAELRRIIFGHNYPGNMLAETTPDSSNSIHYHTHCGRTLVYQVDDVSEYGIKLSSAQVLARTETLITDTYYAEKHVLTRPETSEIIPPKLCHQLPSNIQEPMGNCVHLSSKAVNSVFPYRKEIPETAEMPCNERISQNYTYHPTNETEQLDYEHDFHNYESHFTEPGSMIDGVDETFAVNEEFASVLEDTDSVFEEQNDDTIDDTCTISDEKVHRIVGIVIRHADTRDISPTNWSPDNDDVGETGSRTPTEHFPHTEHQVPGSSSYDRFVLDNAEHELPIKADFQLPSIFSNRSKTSSVENLRRNNSSQFEPHSLTNNFISTKESASPDATMVTISIDSSLNTESTTQEPETGGNSVLVNMIEDYVKMVMEASRELNHTAHEETPQEFASGFPSPSYSSVANIYDSATNSFKLDMSDRIENETLHRDTGNPEIENAGIESEMNKNHESEESLSLADKSVSIHPETESSDEDSDSCSVNTIVEVSGKDQRPELESPAFDNGGFLPVAPRKSSVEKWESVTLKTELENNKQEDENEFFRDSELKIKDLKVRDMETPEKQCQKRDERPGIGSEPFSSYIADEKESILAGDSNGSLIIKQSNSKSLTYVDSEEPLTNFTSASPFLNNSANHENVITSEAENIEQRSIKFQNTRSEGTEKDSIDDPEGIHTIVGKEDVENETVFTSESIKSILLKNGLPHHNAKTDKCVLNSDCVTGETHERLTENEVVEELADLFWTNAIITAVDDNLEDNHSNESEIFNEDILNVVETLLNVVSANETTRAHIDFFSSLSTEVPWPEIPEIENWCSDEVRSCMEQIVKDICLESSNSDQGAPPRENSREISLIDGSDKTECSKFDSSVISNNSSSSEARSTHGFTEFNTAQNGLPSISFDENDVTPLLENSDFSYQETRETKDSHEQPIVIQLEVRTFDNQLKVSQENDLKLETEPIGVNTSEVDIGEAEKFQENQSENSLGSSFTTQEKVLDKYHSALFYQPVGGSSIGDGISMIDVIYCEPEEQKLFISKNQEKAETRLMSESVETLESEIDPFPKSDDSEMTDVENHLHARSSSLSELLQNIDVMQQLDKSKQEPNSDPTIEEFLDCAINKIENDSTTSKEVLDRSIISERAEAVTTETLNFDFVAEYLMEFVLQQDSVVPVGTVTFECVEKTECLEDEEENVSHVVRNLLDAIEVQEVIYEVLGNIVEKMIDSVNQESTIVLETIDSVSSDGSSRCEGEDKDVRTILDFLLNIVDGIHPDGNLEDSHSNNTEAQEHLSNCVLCEEDAVVELMQELLVSVSPNLEERDQHSSHQEFTSSAPSTSSLEKSGIMIKVNNQEEDDQMNSIRELVEYLLETATDSFNDGHRLLSDYLNEGRIPSKQDINNVDQEDIPGVLERILLAVDGLGNEDSQLFTENSYRSEEDVYDVIERLMVIVGSGSEKRETESGLIRRERNSDNTAQERLKGSCKNQEFVENAYVLEGMAAILEHMDDQEKTFLEKNSECAPKEVCFKAGIHTEESQMEGKLAFEDGISSATEMHSSAPNEDYTFQATASISNCQELDENTILDATPEINEVLQNIIEELLQNSMRRNYVNQETNYGNEEFLDMSQETELDVFEDSGFRETSVLELDCIDVFHLCSNLDDNISCPLFCDFERKSALPHDQKNTNTEKIGDQNDEDGMRFVTTKETKDGSEVDHQAEVENNMHDTSTSISEFHAMSDVKIKKVEFLSDDAGEEDLPLVTTMENFLTMGEEELSSRYDKRNLENMCLENEEDVALNGSFTEENTAKVCLDYNSNGIEISCEKGKAAELCPKHLCSAENDSNFCSISGVSNSHSPEVAEYLPKSGTNIATLIDRYVEDLIQDQLCIALSNATELMSGMSTDQRMAPGTYSPNDTQLNPDRFNVSENASIFMTPVGTILKVDVENVNETFEVSYEDNLDLLSKKTIQENAEKEDKFLGPRCVGTIDDTSDMIVANSGAVRTNGNPMRAVLEKNQETLTMEEKLSADSVEYMPNFVKLSSGAKMYEFEKPLPPGPKATALENCITTQNTPGITSDIKHVKNVIIETANVLHHSLSDITQETRISKGEISDDCDDTTGSKIKHLNEAETSKHEHTKSSTPMAAFGTEHLVLSSDVTLRNAPNSHPKHNECSAHEDIVEYVPTNTSLKLPVETSSTESSLKSLEQPSTSLVLKEVSHFLTTACVVALAFMSPSESTSSSFNPDVIEDVSKYFSEEDANDADKI